MIFLQGSFVQDEHAFEESVDAHFAALDNNNGVLSSSELRKALETLRLLETHFGVNVVTPPGELTSLYDSIFDQFDYDHSGVVDLIEFRVEMKKILLAIADGLGSSPIQMAVEEGIGDEESLLKQMVDLEAEKIANATSA